MECPHINQSLDLSKFIQGLIKYSILSDCKKCSVNPIKNNSIISKNMWMCLKCGNQACGRQHGKHALQHYSYYKLHCNSHCLGLDMTTWKVWCYGCDKYLNTEKNQLLFESIKVVQDFVEEDTKKKELLKNNNKSSSIAAGKSGDYDDKALEVIIFQLKGMAPYQKHVAIKLIADVMYYGGMGKLTDACQMSF